jgi:signal transduction histidine kinase
MTPASSRRRRSDQQHDAERLLAEAGNLLASSLDYEATLAGVAQLAVGSLADFCIIDIVEDGEVKRLQVAHSDPMRAELTARLLEFPLDRRRPHLSLDALESGRTIVIPEVTDAVLDSVSQGLEHRGIVEALEPRSFMAVPLAARGRRLGVILFVSSSRPYDEDDVALAERLAQLASVEVDDARLYREATRALSARDRVLGIVAHDLRNPLNVISMSAELLLDPSFSETQRADQVQMILRSAKRMDRLIQDLLDVARIEADRLFLQRTSLDAGRVGREAVELNSSLAAVKSHELRLDVEPGVPLISGDRDRLLQVLSNLIGNAIKFTPAGGAIQIRVEQAPEGVRFGVADTGPGIPADDLGRLFQPFWQAQRGSLDGAGLGLMIARGIVEAHGGTIWAESEEGKGSQFYFTIPAAVTAEKDDRRQGVPDRRTPEEPTGAVDGSSASG